LVVEWAQQIAVDFFPFPLQLMEQIAEALRPSKLHAEAVGQESAGFQD
jgi:hypothetical protein